MNLKKTKRKMKNNNKIIFKSIIFIILMSIFSSCLQEKNNNANETTNQIDVKINDSLDINIFFNKSNAIRTIIIKNRLNGCNSIYGFHNDGVTPSVIGKEKNGQRTGLYYTYYSNGRLNNKINYDQGEFDGNYESFSENGKIIYKAYYEK